MSSVAAASSGELGDQVVAAARRVVRVGVEPFVVRAGRLIDATGAEPVDDGAVIVEGRRITYAGTAAGAPDLPGATVHHFPNATVLPGLIDAHLHLTGDVTNDVYRRYLTPDRRVRPILAAAHAAVMLGAGFTTVRDIGLPGPGRALRDAVAEGLADGPRILTAVAALSQTGGHADWHIFPHEWVSAGAFPRGYMADGVDGCRRAVRRVLREGADVVKLLLESGGVTNTAEDLHAVPEFSDEELRVLVDESHQRGRRVAAHAKSPQVIRRAVEFGVDTIEHGDLDPSDTDIFGLMRDRGVVLVPTLSLYHWVGTEGERWGVFAEGRAASRELLPQRKAMVLAAAQAGVKIATGTDTGSAMAVGRNAMELALFVEAGLTPLAAIEAATRVASEALGLDRMVGTLEPGKLADLVVVDGDPSADIGTLLRDDNPLRVFTTAARPA